MSIFDVLKIQKKIADVITKKNKVIGKRKLKGIKKIKADDLKETKKANEPITLYRAENYPGQEPFLRPDTDPKQELVGRWFTTDKNFASRFARNTKDTKGIKKLKIKPPVRTHADRHKTINELLADRKKLKNWVPEMGMGSGSRKLTTTWKPNVGGHTYKTRLENYLGSDVLRDMITLTPPKSITDTAKFDTWLSLLAILKNKNPRMFQEILTLIKAKRMGLKTGGLV
tara:strand:+ start:9284 stop:9967 length:684 start_codon:yes stop_codon:yes gene_type:complete